MRWTATRHAIGKTYFISNDDPWPQAKIIGALLEASGELKPRSRPYLPAGRTAGRGLAERWWRLRGRADEPPVTRWSAEQLATAHWYDIAPPSATWAICRWSACRKVCSACATGRVTVRRATPALLPERPNRRYRQGRYLSASRASPGPAWAAARARSRSSRSHLRIRHRAASVPRHCP